MVKLLELGFGRLNQPQLTDDGSSLVDEHRGWVLARVDTWLVGLDVGTENETVGHVVHHTHTAVDDSQTIGALGDSGAAGFATESAAGGVGLIVTERIVSQTLPIQKGGVSEITGWLGLVGTYVLRTELGRVTGVDQGGHRIGGHRTEGH